MTKSIRNQGKNKMKRDKKKDLQNASSDGDFPDPKQIKLDDDM